ncbi:MAG: pentapeptide repeat-containing protein [Nostoc sp. ChiSLP01]|nr:globin domain-containing protein [Nostoc sp. CmiSLP01]MDZ8286558.1 globin domain-containing protein [Nostoc sp. ChiSLP01]
MSLNIELLEQSFEQIKPYADDFVASFYTNLFAAHPEVRPLFANTEMEKQQKKLLNSLVLVVENLRYPEVLVAVLDSLGARHVIYGAIPQYYPAVGQALILTFEQYLEDAWTPEHKKAWTDAYGAIAAQMLKRTASVNTEQERSLSVPLTLEPKTIPSPPTATSIPDIPTAEVEETPVLALSELPVELLERSFENIKLHAEEFAASFYENLFQAHPEVKPLFAKTDMALQNKKLLQSLVLVVENLRNPEALNAVLENLGARHVGYGSVPKQYGAINKILLLTFEQYLQENWTPELNRAWKNALTAITQQMLKGTRTESVSVPEIASTTKKANTRQTSELRTQIPNESQEFYPETSQPLRSRRKSRRSQRGQRSLLHRYLWWLRSLIEAVKKIPKQLSKTFWELPTWAIALATVLIMSAVFIFADEHSALGKLLAGVEAISILVAVVLFVKETPDRRKQFQYQAWSTVDAAHGVKVSYARILALQDLNQGGVSLRGLDAPGAELVEINLSHANLSKTNLIESDLTNANLSHANLDNANLTQAKLSGADLSHAKLGFACLSQANLSSANLSGANLICADLSHANLSGANLRDASLSGANLEGAYLTGANLKNAKVSDYELNSAYLEGAIMPDGSKYRSQRKS